MSSRAAQTARDLTSGLSLSRHVTRLRQVAPHLRKAKQLAVVRSLGALRQPRDDTLALAPGEFRFDQLVHERVDRGMIQAIDDFI
jgi:hypothetical protein